MMKKILFLSILHINSISADSFKYDKLNEKCGAHWGPYARFMMIVSTVTVLLNQSSEILIYFMGIKEKNKETTINRKEIKKIN